MAKGERSEHDPARKVDRESHATEVWRRKMTGAMGNAFGDDVANAYDEGLFGKSDPRDVISGEQNVKPTSKRAMKGMGAGQCTYCGSYNTTESSSVTGNDCYDCGSTTHGNWENYYEQ